MASPEGQATLADAANFADMDSVRVVLAREVTMEAGERSEMHSHPDYFVYFLAAGNVRFTTPSGATRGIEVHATENIGSTPVRALFFEPR
jgi:oxalate decarboxylase/phosphoglucose isomerase-like protein (cupin superfamily)